MSKTEIQKFGWFDFWLSIITYIKLVLLSGVPSAEINIFIFIICNAWWILKCQPIFISFCCKNRFHAKMVLQFMLFFIIRSLNPKSCMQNNYSNLRSLSMWNNGLLNCLMLAGKMKWIMYLLEKHFIECVWSWERK